MTLVVDASIVISALVDSGGEGTWAEGVLGSDALIGPDLLPVEVANVLRRAAVTGDISGDSAALAYADLLKLRIGLFAFEPFAERVWELRASVSAYDAWYVALAEALQVPLATLDQRLVRSPGVRCRFVTFPERSGGRFRSKVRAAG